MKIKLFSSFLLASFSLALLVSCNKESGTTDDSGTEGVNTAEAVAGSYVGTVAAEFQYNTDPADPDKYTYYDQTVVLTATGTETVSVSYENEQWGSYTVESVTVSGSDPYTLSGTGTCEMPSMSGGDSTVYSMNFSGTVGVTEGTATFTFNVPDVMGGTYLNFTLGSSE